MRAALFDLGNTLVDEHDVLLDGALEMLAAVSELRDPDGEPIELGLVSDYYPASSPAESERLHQQYYAVLKDSGLAPFFEPLSRRVTLSTEVGVDKPDRAIFVAALEKLDRAAHLHHSIFVTERGDHVAAARRLGMMAIHFKAPGQTNGEVDHLLELVPIIKRLLSFSPCCKKRGEAAGRFKSQSNKSKQLDTAISDLTAQVSVDRLRDTIVKLGAFGTRWTFSAGIRRIPEWIHAQFVEMGYTGNRSPRFQPFRVPGSPIQQRNVLCGPHAEGVGFVLLCAHYDSLSEQPETNAPGADDNASGIAVLLETARIFRDVSLKRGLCFAAFGGEEQGLFGSEACAEVAANQQWPIDAVLNLDMIAFQDPARPRHVVVEYDQGNRDHRNDAAAKAYGLLMAQAAADYTSLEVEHTDIWNSDYIPFEAKGYACIGVYEAGENPGYHKTTDTIDQLQMPHLAEITRMVVATIHKITH